MVFEFKLPDVGEGVAEGELVRWLVSEGDEVKEDQPLAEVETDKAMVEVPAPLDGTIKEMLYEEGDMVPVHDVFVTITPEGDVDEAELEADAGGEESTAPSPNGETASDAGAAEADAGSTGDGEQSVPEGRVFAAPSARRLARELGVDIAAVDGSGPSGRVTEQDVRAHAESASETPEEPEPAETASETADAASEPASADTGGSAGVQTTTAAPSTVESADRDRTLAAPATRRVADELGVDLNRVPADSEKDGEPFVTEAAVRQYAEAAQQAQTADAQAVVSETGERVTREPYRGIRRTIGDAMANSKYTAPHVTHHDTVVVDDLVEARADLKEIAEERGFKLTYMPFVMKAMVAALRDWPALNAELDEEAEEIVQKHYYNVGIAVATDAGLMVPVVNDVDSKGMLELSGEVNELAAKARDRTISREEMQGSTITITNFGAFGGEYATPIINYPEVAIVGLGELKQRPVVQDGEVEAAWTLPISIAIDHRVIDGAEVAQFCNQFMEYLQNPQLLLLE